MEQILSIMLPSGHSELSYDVLIVIQTTLTQNVAVKPWENCWDMSLFEERQPFLAVDSTSDHPRLTDEGTV